ncbi:MAG: prolyl oligopeptidase family serine peptidase [Bacteroidota bacterium]|nr:prolyl oligopeptidase family serine peptidase [Bacteroidota bacterium]MDE2834361.1 prolyl oligopeptidase family serine peptidase [Bacteroidota bacterium]
MKYALTALLLFCVPLGARAQKQALDHSVYEIWNRIGTRSLSADGNWALYSYGPEKGDDTLHVRGLPEGVLHEIPRGTSARFTYDSRHAIFQIEPAADSVRAAKIAGTKDDDLPGDTLGILSLSSGERHYVPEVESYRLPSEAGGFLAYRLEKTDADSLGEGLRLVLRNLTDNQDTTFTNATSFLFNRTGTLLAYTYEKDDSLATGLVVVSTASFTSDTLMAGGGEYKSLRFDERGTQLAFLSSREGLEADPPEFGLYYWQSESDRVDTLATGHSPGIPDGWWVSPDGSLSFADNGSRVFFGTAPRPPAEEEEETPEEDRVVLDVWNWKDPLLQSMQLRQLSREKQRSYRAVVHLSSRAVVQLADEDMPDITLGARGDADVAMGRSNLPYRQQISWDSPGYHDIYRVDLQTGARQLLLDAVQDFPSLSPEAGYITWWDRNVLAWMAIPTDGGTAVNLTGSIDTAFDNELHDWPYAPNDYGSAGWTEGDELFLVYDRHDIWAVDPTGSVPARNVTGGLGHRDNLRFRNVRLDYDVDYVGDYLLLSAFRYDTKASGFYRHAISGRDAPQELVMMDRQWSYPTLADEADRLLFTRQSFTEYGDLWTGGMEFDDMVRISDVNPQQARYNWGTAELVEWTSLDGIPLQGMLFKPESFDPGQQYPMMVYFYEKMSNGLHQYRFPSTASSSISISFYVSRGYLVFVPDIPYKVGYPGESALNAVVPGVTMLVNSGFVQKDRIGVQGHSWGGYQIAYMITESDLFAAAEAGAPVSNMTSAYGGIRWSSGMSRMFQYEKTQSRIGGSLWETPLRYIDNSPLFQADKINTPVLMLHNDDDGAVPWYQGIEFFVALRRLGKPVWMLNYNGEGHGLSKYANRRDFAIRMQQYFDHYLKDEPAPVWMEEGIPAIMKGETLGLEPADHNRP